MMMMRSKFFFFLINLALTLMIYCCFQSLFLHLIIADSSTSCSGAVMECANLGNITYPFWGSASNCAASPSYVLSNCSSSSEAYWDSLSAVAHGVAGPPAVTYVSPHSPYPHDSELSPSSYPNSAPYSYIGLSWNKSLNSTGICASFSSRNLAQYNIPSSINLSSFAELTFSSNNIFLLFNCTNYTPVEEYYESPACVKYYKSACTPQEASCFQYSEYSESPVQELMLQDVLESYSCSHFTFGFGSDQVGLSWTTGSIEVVWTDIQYCDKCHSAGGECIFDTSVSFPAKLINHCHCYDTGAFDFNIHTCEPDTGCPGGLFNCNTGAKVGILAALAIVVLGFGVAIEVCCGSKIRKGLRNGFFSFIKAIIPIVISVLKKTLKKLQTSAYVPSLRLDTMGLDGLTERPMEYSYSSIASATKSFSILVGEGGFGVVYKGTLSQASGDGRLDLQIAVKVLEVRSKHSKQQFLNEVITIGRIHHVNVVRLLGFCMQEDHEMLVYEYIENGSLDRWLFDKQGKDEKQVLDWGQRYAIAMGIARGLSYLHEECRHRTVHCDIKPQNILLDREMCPKIADFGLARLMSRDESKVLTIAKGTPGYMAPEFWMGGESQLNTKFDVYSYGMVLLELISGQHNYRRDAMSIGTSFPAMAFKAATQGDLESILDPHLGITKNTPDSEEANKLQWHQIKTAVFVALWCIQEHPANRPYTSEVVKYLEGAASVSECLPQPTVSIFSTSSTPPEPHSMHRQQDFTPITTGR